jgi:hypothetical protein
MRFDGNGALAGFAVENNPGPGLGRTHCHIDTIAAVKADTGNQDRIGNGTLGNHFKSFQSSP